MERRGRREKRVVVFRLAASCSCRCRPVSVERDDAQEGEDGGAAGTRKDAAAAGAGTPGRTRARGSVPVRARD